MHSNQTLISPEDRWRNIVRQQREVGYLWCNKVLIGISSEPLSGYYSLRTSVLKTINVLDAD